MSFYIFIFTWFRVVRDFYAKFIYKVFFHFYKFLVYGHVKTELIFTIYYARLEKNWQNIIVKHEIRECVLPRDEGDPVLTDNTKNLKFQKVFKTNEKNWYISKNSFMFVQFIESIYWVYSSRASVYIARAELQAKGWPSSVSPALVPDKRRPGLNYYTNTKINLWNNF